LPGGTDGNYENQQLRELLFAWRLEPNTPRKSFKRVEVLVCLHGSDVISHVTALKRKHLGTETNIMEENACCEADGRTSDYKIQSFILRRVIAVLLQYK
jgi:hypothetical protein